MSRFACKGPDPIGSGPLPWYLYVCYNRGMTKDSGTPNRMARDFAAMDKAMGTDGAPASGTKPATPSTLAGFQSKAPRPMTRQARLSKGNADALRKLADGDW